MRRLDQRGETLVEVVMALGILSLVLVSSYALATGTFRLGRGAGDRTQAVSYLQQQAEALRTYRNEHDWDTFDRTVGSYTPKGSTFCMTIDDTRHWNPGTTGCVINGVTLSIHPTAVGSPRKQYDFELVATWNDSRGKNNVRITTTLTDQTP